MNNKPIVLVTYDPKVNPLRPRDREGYAGVDGGESSPMVRIVMIPSDDHCAYVVEGGELDATGIISWRKLVLCDETLAIETLGRYITDLRSAQPIVSVPEEWRKLPFGDIRSDAAYLIDMAAWPADKRAEHARDDQFAWNMRYVARALAEEPNRGDVWACKIAERIHNADLEAATKKIDRLETEARELREANKALDGWNALLEECRITIKNQRAEIAELRGEPEPQTGPLYTIDAGIAELDARIAVLSLDRIQGEAEIDIKVTYRFIAPDGRSFFVRRGMLEGDDRDWPMVGRYEFDAVDSNGKSVLKNPIRVEHFTAKSMTKRKGPGNV